MLRSTLLCGLLVLVCGMFTGMTVMAKEGDPAPDITLKDDTGADVNVASFKGKSGVVVFFYPKADTPGCTKESCNFRDEIKTFQAKGYAVFGASRDSVEAQAAFKKKYDLNYPLLSDPESKLATALGFKPGARNTAIIGKDGKIEKVVLQVAAPTHATDLLKDLK